jgi:hypothetical protein
MRLVVFKKFTHLECGGARKWHGPERDDGAGVFAENDGRATPQVQKKSANKAPYWPFSA